MTIKELVCYAARLADEKKAENVRVIDLCGASSLCDFILIATATSKPHLEAVEEEISKKLKEEGYYKTNRDGGNSFQWRVSDYGAFLVHLMTQEARDHYMLEKMFSFGKEVDFSKPVKKAVKKAPVKKATKPAKKTTAKKTTAKKSTVKKTAKKTVKKTAKKASVKTAKKTVKKTTKKK